MAENTARVLDQKVIGIKRAKGDVPLVQVLGGAAAAVQLELRVPVSCPRTCSILGMMPGRHLRFSQLFSWCL